MTGHESRESENARTKDVEKKRSKVIRERWHKRGPVFVCEDQSQNSEISKTYHCASVRPP